MIDDLTNDLEQRVLGMGFTSVGIVDPGPSEHMAMYREWVEKNLHGEMAYLAREDSLDRREDLRRTFDTVKSVVVVSQNYFQKDSPGVPEDPSRGVVSRYARGVDYHLLMKDRLNSLLAWIREEAIERGLAGDVGGFAYVDTGPILEKELAQRAGLGWFGKNTLLIHPRRGSHFFLGLLLLDLELPASAPFENDHCGSCTACLDACPTGALLGRDRNGAPVMDASRCISYLTIELKGSIPRELREGIGHRIFGCDICQECCPWNRKFAEDATEPAYVAGSNTDGPGLVELMGLSDDEFATRFSGNPVKRAKRRGLLRNVAVALGNWGGREAVPALATALDDEEPLIRGHAAWALGRILSRVGKPGDGGLEVVEALRFRLNEEDDPWVEEEIKEALRGEESLPGAHRLRGTRELSPLVSRAKAENQSRVPS